MGHLPIFKATALPGRKEGVSGSYIISTNLGVDNYISQERKEAAIEFMKFISMKETHKKYIINNYFFSGITELYDDEEVCNVIECDIIKNVYPFSFMDNDVNLFGNDKFQKKYKDTIFEYLYNDKPINEVLKKIENISKFYTFTWKTDESNIGLIIFIIFLVFSANIALSLIFLFIKKLNRKFRFLTKDFWIITILGSLIILSSVITLYGNVTNVKCHLRTALINVGFALSICPSLHKLIKNFPEKNKISIWFGNNKYIYVLIIMIFTVCLNGINMLSPYDLQHLVTSDEKNYLRCTMNNKYGNLVYYITQIYDFSLILISLILIFLEWNLKETYLDVNFIASALFTDILSLILLNIIDNIKFKNYIIYNSLLAINILFFAISNHLFTYLIRVIIMIGNNSENYEDSKNILGKVTNTSAKRITNTSNNTSNNDVVTSKSISVASSEDSKLVGFSKKIMSYHNQTTISLN